MQGCGQIVRVCGSEDAQQQLAPSVSVAECQSVPSHCGSENQGARQAVRQHQWEPQTHGATVRPVGSAVSKSPWAEYRTLDTGFSSLCLQLQSLLNGAASHLGFRVLLAPPRQGQARGHPAPSTGPPEAVTEPGGRWHT